LNWNKWIRQTHRWLSIAMTVAILVNFVAVVAGRYTRWLGLSAVLYPMNPAERIDELLAKLTDWRGETLGSIRKCLLQADREIIEEWKWMGSPVWSHDGIIAVGNAHKDKVKLTFSHGASLPDADKLFNAGFGGNTRRASDFFEGDKINVRALKNLVRAAVDYNQIKLKRKAPAGTRAKAHKSNK
jgi:hypothetical protein